MVFINGTITTFAGNGFTGYSGDNGPALSASLHQPYSVAISPNGKIYISDSVNNCVRVVFTNGSITTFSGNGTQGYS